MISHQIYLYVNSAYRSTTETLCNRFCRTLRFWVLDWYGDVTFSITLTRSFRDIVDDFASGRSALRGYIDATTRFGT